jgi:hypothetical protein
VFRYVLQFALGLGLHRLDFEAVVEYPLQLALVAPQCPDGRRVLQSHNPLLKDFRRPGRLTELLARFQRQRHAVHRLPRRMQ